jgi:hypothetical protein
MDSVISAPPLAFPPEVTQSAPPGEFVGGAASPTKNQTSRNALQWFIRWVCIISLFLIGLAVLAMAGIASYFHLTSSTRALRGAVMDSVDGRWHRHFAINVGGGTLALARLVTSFVRLPPDARIALRCLDNADVGVYELEDTISAPDYALLLSTADKSMRTKGWERIVGVIDGRQFVAVYAPHNNRGKDISCSVVVLDDRNLVVVSARGDTGPMMELVQRHLKTKGFGNLGQPGWQ